ncbi:hypothetical protein B0T26DRAFT_597963, partial [Lasiosphaeria miniovina]
MATAFESPAQYERDLRSANRPYKRTKDSSAKWHYGKQETSGVRVDQVTGEFLSGNPGQHAKVRPVSKGHHWSATPAQKREHNIVKSRGNWEMPSGRVRSKIYANREISDAATTKSVGELSPATPLSARLPDVLYSFDRADTPGRPVTLDIFVKRATGRDTERLVEREYEVLDTNGEALKGRRARRILRQ